MGSLTAKFAGEMPAQRWNIRRARPQVTSFLFLRYLPLEVFCAGIFLSFAAHVVLVEISGAIWMQIVISIVGILMMTALAYYRSWSKKADKAPTKPKPIVAAAG